MFIVIKDGLTILNYNLEQINLPFLYKGIEIYKSNNDLYISLKNGYYFLDRDKERLLEEKKYIIKNKDIFNDIELLVYKNDKGIDLFRLYENKPFIYLASKDANIVNRDKNLKNLFLTYKQGKLNTNCNCLTLNGKLYNNEILKDGDEVQMYNFKLIYYEEYLYINNFLTDIRIKRKALKENLIKYQNEIEPINSYYLEPIKDLIIKPLEEYNEIKPNKEKKLIYQIGPSLTMTMATLAIASINVYNNYLNDQPWLNSLIYIIMPVTMLFSGVLWPIISRLADKKDIKKEISLNKQEYIDYLINYRNDLTKDIEINIKEKNKYFFTGEIDSNKLFYITNKHKEFLSISLGHITLSKEFKYKIYKDETINEKIGGIKYQLNNIDNYPYFISVLDYKTISFVLKKSIRDYLIKKYLLEISSKYHFDDFYMAIYSSNLSNYSSFYSLPQLILNNNRLTLNNAKDLQELNNTNLDKPLIIFSDKRININFTNPKIHLLSFTLDKNDIHKDTELLIEYFDDYGYIYKDNKIKFKYEIKEINFKEYTDILGNYQKINYLKHVRTFKDIFEDFNIKDFYLAKQQSLQADFAYINNEVLSFDLHETKSGPHGLIGGATGSGKSELIVSLLLSLCIRYRPDYLNMILIDYKGGGIKESLSYNGKILPHIIASIDNLSNDVFERLMVAIDFECKRRQRLFKELSNKSMTSIMNIDDYLQGDYQNYNLPKLAHLLIVVDEFAELKKENPSIIKGLISFARVGRSLGIHLILATQRPSGVIDDEIWSNSRFKIALKVFNEKDSNDIIKSKEAAYLTSPGDFILNIDGNTSKASAIYSKKDINNGDPYEVSLLNNKLDVLAKRSIKANNTILENNYIVSKILKCIEELDIKSNILEFDKPSNESIDSLKTKYKVDSNRLILGEIDDYLNAYKGILEVSKKENILIYSSRDNEINNILNQLDNKTVVIGQNRYFNRCICDSIKYDETDDLNYLFNKLINNKQDISLVIEDLNCLLSYGEDTSNKLFNIIRRSEVNKVNVIAISKQSSINFKLINSFKHKICICINDKQDLINIFSSNSQYIGNSYFYKEKLISFIPCVIERFKNNETIYKSILDKIPEKVNYQRNDNETLIGYNLLSRKKVYLRDDDKLLISSYNEETINKYLKLFKKNHNIEVKIYDKSLIAKDYKRILWLDDGLYTQRLFYVDGKYELNPGQGMLYKDNKSEIIKVINNE